MKKVHHFEKQSDLTNSIETMSNNQKPGGDDDGSEFAVQQPSMSPDVANGSHSSFATSDQSKMVRPQFLVSNVLLPLAFAHHSTYSFGSILEESQSRRDHAKSWWLCWHGR